MDGSRIFIASARYAVAAAAARAAGAVGRGGFGPGGEPHPIPAGTNADRSDPRISFRFVTSIIKMGSTYQIQDQQQEPGNKQNGDNVSDS